MKRRKNEKGRRKKVERERTSGRNGWKEESEEEVGRERERDRESEGTV